MSILAYRWAPATPLLQTLSLFLYYINSQFSADSQFSAIGEFTNNWLCLQMKPWKNHQPPLVGTSQIPNSSLTPLNDAPTQQEVARSISAHNTNKRLKCLVPGILGAGGMS
jgi:hypothetical protein